MKAQEALKAFKDAQLVETYTLGDFTGTADGDMKQYTELKIAAAQEVEAFKKFQELKNVAFSELEKVNDEARIVLGKEWQVKEDSQF